MGYATSLHPQKTAWSSITIKLAKKLRGLCPSHLGSGKWQAQLQRRWRSRLPNLTAPKSLQHALDIPLHCSVLVMSTMSEQTCRKLVLSACKNQSLHVSNSAIEHCCVLRLWGCRSFKLILKGRTSPACVCNTEERLPRLLEKASFGRACWANEAGRYFWYYKWDQLIYTTNKLLLRVES